MPGTAVSDVKLGFFLMIGFFLAMVLLGLVMGLFTK